MPRDDQPEKQPDQPTLPHPVVDTPGLDKLEGSLNDLSKAAATQSLTYLLLWLYLIFTVTAVTDYDLLIEKPIKLPIFDLQVGLLKFFIGAPALFWLVQLYMVRKVSVIADAVRHYLTVAEREAAKHAASPHAVLEALRHRVDGFVLTRLLARFDTVRCGDESGPATPPLPQALTVLAAAVTLVLAPVLLFGAFQIRFLAYQHEGITWWHRICLFSGLALSAVAARQAGLTWADTARALRALGAGLFGGLLPNRRARRTRPESERWLDHLSLQLAANAVPAVVAASLLVATTPGEFLSDGVIIEKNPLGDLLAEKLVPRSLHPRLPNSPLVAAIAPASTDETAKPGPLPLNLSHWDFSGRSLRKANLSGAILNRTIMHGTQLQGAILRNSQLENAIMEDAQLDNAVLTEAKLNGVNLKKAKIRGSELIDVNLNSANLEGADIRGSNLLRADLQDAKLEKVHGQGASLNYAKMQGVNLILAKFQGSDLEGAKLHGSILFGTALTLANLKNAQLPWAYMFQVNLQGADLHGAQLQWAHIIFAQLHGADLRETQLRGATLAAASVWQTRLDDAIATDLGSSDFWPLLLIDEKANYLKDISRQLHDFPVSKQKTAAEERLAYLLNSNLSDQEERRYASNLHYILQQRVITPEEHAMQLVAHACNDSHNIFGALMMSYSNPVSPPTDKEKPYASRFAAVLKDPSTCPSLRKLSPAHRRVFLEWAERQ